MFVNAGAVLRKIASKKAIRLTVLRYAVDSRSNPKHGAKLAGRPWSVTRSTGASDGRALRARRCSPSETKIVRAPLWSGLSLWMLWHATVRVEQSFPGRPFGYGPPSARSAGCHNVASRARALGQRHVVRWLSKPEARNPSEMAPTAIPPHSPVVVSAWYCSPDTVNASGRNDNDRYARHTRSAGSHRARGAALVDRVGDWQGNAASRREARVNAEPGKPWVKEGRAHWGGP